MNLQVTIRPILIAYGHQCTMAIARLIAILLDKLINNYRLQLDTITSPQSAGDWPAVATLPMQISVA